MSHRMEKSKVQQVAAELARESDLLLEVHTAARGLLAVAKGRVEDANRRLAHRRSTPRGTVSENGETAQRPSMDA